MHTRAGPPATQSDPRALAELARALRIRTLRMTHRAKSSHIGTCFSMAELLAVLYGGVLRVDPARPDWPDRDRFVLSKGHGCAILYAVLAERGFFPASWLDRFYQDGSPLWGHESFGTVKQVLDLEPLAEKWRAFGWAVREIDGHAIEAIVEGCERVPFERGLPSCIIAHTVKGKGVSFMEDDLLWHYRSPDADEFRRALQELGAEP